MPKDKKFLTISVPTFQRTQQFTNLANQFLNRLMEDYADDIVIKIYDNSDPAIANLKKEACHNDIIYNVNKGNIGFAENFINCLYGNDTKYTWVISDDDEIDYDKFIQFYDQYHKEFQYDLIIVPFTSRTTTNDILIKSNSENLKVPSTGEFREFISNGEVPFIFFATAIIKSPIKATKRISKFSKNAYVQTIAFCEALNEKSKYKIIDQVIINYKPGYIGQTASVKWMSQSLIEVRKYLSIRFEYKHEEGADINGWLLWLLHHRGGQYLLHDGDKDRAYITRITLQFPSWKRILLVCSLWLPNIIIRPIYLLYWTAKDMKHIEGQKEYKTTTLAYVFLKRLSKNYYFARNLRSSKI